MKPTLIVVVALFLLLELPHAVADEHDCDDAVVVDERGESLPGGRWRRGHNSNAEDNGRPAVMQIWEHPTGSAVWRLVRRQAPPGPWRADRSDGTHCGPSRDLPGTLCCATQGLRSR